MAAYKQPCLTVLTVNGDDSHGKRSKSTSTAEPSEIRSALMKDSIEESDIVLMQEIRCKTLIKRNHEKTHKIDCHNDDVGILVKKDTFTDNVHFISAANYQNEIDRLNAKYAENDNERLLPGRFFMCLATVASTNTPVLFVSYHGGYKGVKSPQQKTMLHILLRFLIKQEKRLTASPLHIVVGGDFNLGINEVDLTNIPEFQPPHLYIPTSRRRTAKLIDYFILSKNIQFVGITALKFNKRVIKKYELTDDDIRSYLDHDPVRISVSFPESETNFVPLMQPMDVKPKHPESKRETVKPKIKDDEVRLKDSSKITQKPKKTTKKEQKLDACNMQPVDIKPKPYHQPKTEGEKFKPIVKDDDVRSKDLSKIPQNKKIIKTETLKEVEGAKARIRLSEMCDNVGATLTQIVSSDKPVSPTIDNPHMIEVRSRITEKKRRQTPKKK